MPADSPDHERRSISQYVEGQNGGEVVHAEKMTSARLLGRSHDVWDVHTTEDRFWVITNLTNLYSQARFRSMDETLSFHIGLMLRMSERESNTPTVENRDLFSTAWRIYERAVASMDHAIESEDFEAVGIRCRDALIASVKGAIEVIPGLEPEPRPKSGDFKGWTREIATHLVAKRARAYISGIAELTWNLVVELGHNSIASEADAELVLDATSHFLNVFGVLLIRSKREGQQRCPQCGSVRLGTDYRDDYENKENPWYVVCAACSAEWSEPPF